MQRQKVRALVYRVESTISEKFTEIASLVLGDVKTGKYYGVILFMRFQVKISGEP